MKIVIFILLTLCLIILQTAAFPDFFLSNHFFDLLLINIIYISLVSRHPATILIVILIGTVVDSVSGMYFGLYLTTYIWIYVIVQGSKQIVFSRNIVFYIVISFVAVTIETLFLILSVFINMGQSGVAALNYYLMVKQIILASVFIPIVLKIVTVFQKSRG